MMCKHFAVQKINLTAPQPIIPSVVVIGPSLENSGKEFKAPFITEPSPTHPVLFQTAVATDVTSCQMCL